MIYRLRDAGVWVPAPHNFIDGILIMEMIEGQDGIPHDRHNSGLAGLGPRERLRKTCQLISSRVVSVSHRTRTGYLDVHLLVLQSNVHPDFALVGPPCSPAAGGHHA